MLLGIGLQAIEAQVQGQHDLRCISPAYIISYAI